MPAGALFGKHPNSYAIKNGCDYGFLSGNANVHRFGPPNGGIKFELNGQEDVMGCGLVLNPEGKVAIFFTVNGTLLGKLFHIRPPFSTPKFWRIPGRLGIWVNHRFRLLLKLIERNCMQLQAITITVY
jgi:hypothetical protein